MEFRKSKHNVQHFKRSSFNTETNNKIIQLIHDFSIDNHKAQQISNIFQKYADKSHCISYLRLLDILKKEFLMIGTSEIEGNFPDIKQKKIDIIAFAKIYIELNNRNSQDKSYDQQILNVFVVLGGNQDKTGSISKYTIIKIIKDQFQLTFDIEKELFKNNKSNYLTYNEFIDIFQRMDPTEKLIVSEKLIGDGMKIESDEKDGNLKIRYQDFENWLKIHYD